MEIRLRDSYMVALAKLGTAEQERIEKFLSKLNRDPTTLGLHVEPVDNGFVSIRANQRIRVIAQQQGDVLLLHYIGDHDPAYEWAKKRRLLASLEDGSYRFTADDGLGTHIASDETLLSPVNAMPYGEQVVGKLTGSNLPAYVIRSLETCQDEDELYERLETLPQHLQYATLAAIQDLPYDPRLGMRVDEIGAIATSPQDTDIPSVEAQDAKTPERLKPVANTEVASTTSAVQPPPRDPDLTTSESPATSPNEALAIPVIVSKAAEDAGENDPAPYRNQPETSSDTGITITYEATRLLFRAKLIEPLDPSQSFRIITPCGVFEMTKSEFYEAFPNVVASASYRGSGIYHYASLPRKALAYRVGDETKP